jgi:hypothetical protein
MKEPLNAVRFRLALGKLPTCVVALLLLLVSMRLFDRSNWLKNQSSTSSTRPQLEEAVLNGLSP